MKDYGRNGLQKKGKKKKRNFEVIMNIGTQGIYSDLTLRKVAKKVTRELVGKKKFIVFHLREITKKEKYGKTYGTSLISQSKINNETIINSQANLYGSLISQSKINNETIINSQANLYGPYIGNIKDGKAIVRIHKMSGGDLIDCVFKRIKINNFRCDGKNPPEIKITKFCFTMATIIFFDFLEYNKKKYYKYVIYKEDDKIFVIELEISDDNKLEIKQIGINEIEKNEKLKRKIILEKIMGKIKEKQVKNPKFALKIQKEIQDELGSIKNNENKIFNSPEIFFSQPKNSDENLESERINRNLTNAFKNYKPIITLAPQIKKLIQNFKTPPINNSEKEFLKFYICPTENFAEVRQNAYGQIQFDPELFTDILYYKYIYFGNNTFRELVKNDRGYYDISIDISNIPLYDLLCLLEFTKMNNIGDLSKLIIANINFRKQNGLFTISLSDHKFSKLENSNYNKKRPTNIGKIKKQDLTKTYYFFGENTPNNFKYACYRLDDKIFYFEIGNNMKKLLLEELKDREALQELKSFIILRRLDKNDPNFGDKIYPKVSEIIRKLKLDEILPKKQVSILPISSTII
jgi:hypothetical protein